MCCAFRVNQDLLFLSDFTKRSKTQESHIAAIVCSLKMKNVIILPAVAETFNFFVHSGVRRLRARRNLQDANVLKGSVRLAPLEIVNASCFHLSLSRRAAAALARIPLAEICARLAPRDDCTLSLSKHGLSLSLLVDISRNRDLVLAHPRV